MYAMLLEGVLKEKIWGGEDLESYNKFSPDKKIGESWEIACHAQGASRVKNGRYKGLTLCDLLADAKHNIFLQEMSNFPLLVKYIDAKADLSLQVHPDDEYSHEHNQPYGKTEAWYILEAEEGAEIILGTNEKNIEELKEHILHNEELEHSNRIKVKQVRFILYPLGRYMQLAKVLFC